MERKISPLFLAAALAALLLIIGSVAMAQDASTENMQFFIEKIKADKKLIVAENLELSRAEAKVFWPVYEGYQDELFFFAPATEVNQGLWGCIWDDDQCDREEAA